MYRKNFSEFRSIQIAESNIGNKNKIIREVLGEVKLADWFATASIGYDNYNGRGVINIDFVNIKGGEVELMEVFLHGEVTGNRYDMKKEIARVIKKRFDCGMSYTIENTNKGSEGLAKALKANEILKSEISQLVADSLELEIVIRNNREHASIAKDSYIVNVR